MKIDITNLQDIVRPNRPALRQAAKAALKDFLGCYSIVLMDDEQMRDVNQEYLGRDETTDVIAFPFRDAPLSRDDCAGEIIVSTERAAAEAARRKIDVESELALYVVHGALHLAGFDDTTPEQASLMHQREKELLGALGYDADRLWKPLKRQTRRERRR